MSGADRIKRRIEAGLARVHIKTGGEPMTAAVVKPGVADESVYPPIPVDGPRLPCTIFIGSYSIKEAATSLVSLAEQKLMVVGDDLDLGSDDVIEVTVGSLSYQLALSNISPFQPAGTVLYYRATGNVIS